AGSGRARVRDTERHRLGPQHHCQGRRCRRRFRRAAGGDQTDHQVARGAIMSEPNLSLDALLTPPPIESAMAMAPSRVLETIILRFLARIINADGTIDPKELSMLVDISIQL